MNPQWRTNRHLHPTRQPKFDSPLNREPFNSDSIEMGAPGTYRYRPFELDTLENVNASPAQNLGTTAAAWILGGRAQKMGVSQAVT